MGAKVAGENLKIPFVIAKLADAPQPLQPFFVPYDDKFRLNLDGDHPDVAALRAELDAAKAKLPEFRDSNRSMHGELQAWKALGVTADEAKAALARLAELEAEAKTASEAATKLRETESALAAERLRGTVGFAFLRDGGQEAAMDIAVDRAAKVFRFDEKTGALTTDARDAQGARLTPEAWMRDLAITAPFLFKPSKGGGAGGTRTGPPVDARAVVDRHDPLAFGRAIEDIAAGKARVS